MQKDQLIITIVNVFHDDLSRLKLSIHGNLQVLHFAHHHWVLLNISLDLDGYSEVVVAAKLFHSTFDKVGLSFFERNPFAAGTGTVFLNTIQVVSVADPRGELIDSRQLLSVTALEAKV
jgi:hypothetical protein